MLAPDSTLGSASSPPVSARTHERNERWRPLTREHADDAEQNLCRAFLVSAPVQNKSWATRVMRTFSTDCTGLQRSLADSYMLGSSPGACRIEMHTSPFA